MNETLTMSDHLTHRIIKLEDGGVPRTVYAARKLGASVQSQMDRAHHDLVIAATDDVSELPQEHRQWAYDLRRSRNRLCGGVLRFIDLLHRRGFSMETALEIPRWLETYIRAKWSHRPVERATQLRKVG